MTQHDNTTGERGLGILNSGASFATDRSAGLRDKLPPRVTSTPPTGSEAASASTQTQPGPAQTQTPPSPASKPAQGPAGSTGRPSDGVGAQNRAAHLAIEVMERLRAYSAEHKVTQTEVIFSAIERAHAAGTLAGSFSPPPAEGLFARPTQRRRRDGRTRPQLTLRLTPRNEQVLDQLVDELGAGSRSELIEVALEQFFGDT